MERILCLRLLLLLWVLTINGCDQRPNAPDQPAQQPGPANTSSERKETHPEQPTGKPQSDAVVPPTGSR